jgi:hypothetical protein
MSCGSLQSGPQLPFKRDLVVQSTTTQKRESRFKFLDGLFGNRGEERQSEDEFEILMRDSSVVAALANQLTSHSKWIPYPFLVDRLKKIADELRSFADLLRRRISELMKSEHIITGQTSLKELKPSESKVDEISGQTDKRPGMGGAHLERSGLPRRNVDLLVNDLEELSNFYQDLQGQNYRKTDPETAELIRHIIFDIDEQYEELTDIIMRLA